jgi:hypothetical protein
MDALVAEYFRGRPRQEIPHILQMFDTKKYVLLLIYFFSFQIFPIL